MANQNARPTGRVHYWTGLLVATWALVSAPAAMAACRVSDFMTRPLSSLSEIQRLAFVSQMTPTEYTKFKQAARGSRDYYSVIANSANLAEARQSAQAKINDLPVEDSDEYARIWGSDFLDDEQLREYVSCSTNRKPGIAFSGRSAGPGVFNFAFAHLTPLDVVKITLRVVASHNIANIDEFEAFLLQLGERDAFPAQTFPLRLSNQNKSAVLIMRAGYETPAFVYIPAYPAPDVR